MRKAFSVPALVLFCSALLAAEKSGRPWVGVNVEAVAKLPADAGHPATAGIRLTMVQTGGPGYRSGLRTGDVILSVDGKALTCPAAEVIAVFLGAIRSRRPGETMRLEVLRDVVDLRAESGDRPLDDESARDPVGFLEKSPPGTAVVVRGSKTRRVLAVDVVLGARHGADARPLPPNDVLRPGSDGERPPCEGLALRIMERAGQSEDFQDLLQRLRSLHAAHDGFGLSPVAVCHRDPFGAEREARRVAAALEEGLRDGPAGLQRILAACAGLLDRPLTSPAPPPLATGLSPSSHARQIQSVLYAAGEEILRAFAGLTADEKDLLARHRLDVSEQFLEHIYLFADKDPRRMERNFRIVRIGRKVDLAALLRAARHLLRLGDPAYLAGLRADLTVAYGKDIAKGVLLRHGTDLGQIVFAGTARNWHKEEGVVAIFDLGGDDFYTLGSLAGNSFERPVGVIVDFDGADAYASTTSQALASGSLGAAFIADLGGDDRYTALRWAQGSGFFGVGVLADWSGDDVYRGEELCQGVGCFGAGILADFAGRDRYEGKRFVQAVGMPRGAGVLLDAGGDDGYYGKGRTPSGYGTHGIFEGWSQACGVGFRQWASGGLGILVDGAGRDHYEAGNFSQGGGYYFGMGVLSDRGKGNDTYIGSRYNQGFSAHQAVGAFFEEGGDDFYTARNGVAQGLAWDQSVSVFVDRSGNDTYRGGSFFSQGASAHNGFCLFLDRGGKDRYAYTPGQARAGGNTYHGGTSFSLFIDEGGDEDIYGHKERNGTIRTGGENFAFLDLGGTAADAAREDAWAAAWKGKKLKKKKKD
jgi:hypothetical protein